MQRSEAEKVFMENDAVEWEVVGGGLRRKVMAWNDGVMLVKVEFQEGAAGAVYRHLHTQVSYVESGMFELK